MKTGVHQNLSGTCPKTDRMPRLQSAASVFGMVPEPAGGPPSANFGDLAKVVGSQGTFQPPVRLMSQAILFPRLAWFPMKTLFPRLPLLLFLAIALPPHPANGQAQERERRLVERFDTNKDGVLDREERQAARSFVKENPRQSGPGRRGPGGRGGPGRGGSSGPQPSPGPEVSPDTVEVISEKKAGLYAPDVLRTVFLEFEEADWEDELADFYRTDVMVPAKMTVDGKTYANVGIGFRGNSSFFTLKKGQKRSFNITMDYADSKQDLYGYRTLNFLNGHADPSFLREVLYNRIARNYTAAPQGNFVRLVINGRSWGIYGNVQQQNKDFTDEWFDSRGGVRWKVSPGPGSEGSSLQYHGPDEQPYGGYQLKSKDTAEARPALIRFLKVLNQTPIDQLHEKLEDVMSVDAALWFLALDNALIDTDGYYSRGSDYMLYQQPDDGRFHVLLYDSNETFRTPGHGGPPGGPGGRRPGGPPGSGPPRGPGNIRDSVFRGDPPQRQQGRGEPPGRGPGGGESSTALDLSPYAGEDRETFALTARLLKNPILRARYTAHVRTITNEWMNWSKTGALIADYRSLIEEDVQQDTRKLYHFEDFVKNMKDDIPGRRTTPGLERFVRERGDFLRRHPDISRKAPKLTKLTHTAGENSFTVTASAEHEANKLRMFVHSAGDRHLRFRATEMFDDGKHNDGTAGDGTWGAVIPAIGRQYFYVEARTVEETPVISFVPEATERGAIKVKPALSRGLGSPVVINEVMSANTKTMQDPQGNYDDWIELHNTSDEEVDVSGLHLTDTPSVPRKWRFPKGTRIEAHQYLIVWADEDGKDSGLHASFKLSKSGESIFLVNADGDTQLDMVKIPKAADDQAFGRLPGNKTLQKVTPTPGAQNRP